jgi:hypothetical protein
MDRTASVQRYGTRDTPDLSQRGLALAIPSGVLETVSGTFGMLIAVRVFEMDDLGEVDLPERDERRADDESLRGAAAAALTLHAGDDRGAGAVSRRGHFWRWRRCFLMSAWVFIIGLQPWAVLFFHADPPADADLDRLNYPEAARGRLFSIAGVLRAASAVGFGFFGGWLIGLRSRALPLAAVGVRGLCLCIRISDTAAAFGGMERAGRMRRRAYGRRCVG